MPDYFKILFKKFIAGKCTPEELEKLAEWLSKDDQEKNVREELRALYNEIDQTMISDSFIDIHGNVEKKHDAKRIMTIQSIVRYAAVACTILIVGICLFFWKNKESVKHVSLKNASTVLRDSGSNVQNIVHIANRGEQKRILLSDGTQIWLNAGSKLEVPVVFDKKERIVSLIGDAYFDVKHADKIPFIIHTSNHVYTKVLGTAFEVNAYENRDFVVSVKRGKVQVGKGKKIIATITIGKKLVLKNNIIDSSTEIYSQLKTIKKEDIADWTNGKLHYDSMSMQDIVNDIERIFDVKVNLSDVKMKNEIFTLSINHDNGAEFAIQALATLAECSYRKEPNGAYTIY